MAAGGFKEFVAGETLDEDEINDFLMQGVLVFAGTAARGSAITAPVEGQFSFRTDDDVLEFYDGSAWVALESGTGDADFSNTATGTYTEGGVNYKFVTFTSSGTLTVTETGLADVLVVAGGGGGGGSGVGSQYGAGGGAGGRVELQVVLSAGSISVVVGAGGAGGAATTGSPGENSNIGLVQGLRGGAGGGAGVAGLFGGSGGGGGSGGAAGGLTVMSSSGEQWCSRRRR
jgi:hypothetical protein